jgi:hypothetical protein
MRQQYIRHRGLSIFWFCSMMMKMEVELMKVFGFKTFDLLTLYIKMTFKVVCILIRKINEFP